MKSFVKVIGKLWMGADGTIEYPVSVNIRQLQPLTKDAIIKLLEGKDFQEIYDCEALIEFYTDEKIDKVVDWEIITTTEKYYHFPWDSKANEEKWLDFLYGDDEE